VARSSLLVTGHIHHEKCCECTETASIAADLLCVWHRSWTTTFSAGVVMCSVTATDIQQCWWQADGGRYWTISREVPSDGIRRRGR